MNYKWNEDPRAMRRQAMKDTGEGGILQGLFVGAWLAAGIWAIGICAWMWAA